MATAQERLAGDDGERARERFRRNVTMVCEIAGLSVRRAAGLADLAEATLRSWLLDGDEDHAKDPTLGNIEKLADALGVDVGDLLLPTDELRQKVEAEGLRPFVLRRPGITRLRSSSPSAAAADTDDSDTMGATRTSPRGSRITARDQRGRTAA